MRQGLWLLAGSVLANVVWAAPRQEILLNGPWEMVKVKSLDEPVPQTGWQACEVPDVINGYNYERAWFRRAFALPESWRGKRVIVRFGGVKFNSRVFANGQRVGGCFNGYDAFELDVTDAIRFGADNELRVGVHDWTGLFTGDLVDFGKARGWDALRNAPTDRILGPIGGVFTAYGLWDDVSLRAVPPVHFVDLFVRPSVRQQRLEVDVTVANAGKGSFKGEVEGRLLPWDGSPRDGNGQWPTKREPVASLPAMKVEVAAGEQKLVTLRLDKPPLQPWWPNQPRLYILELRFDNADSDVLGERIGFRELWTRGGDFYLNGAKVHLLATSWWPTGKPMPREEITAQIKAIKAMNAVCFRTHTQPWPERWYETADELGLMMIPEGAVWNDDEVYRVNDPAFWKNYGDHLRAMVRRLRNHPSIIMWSLENELTGSRVKDGSPPEEELAKLGRWVKQEDSTRPITFESDGDPGGVADVIGIHYPNEYPGRRCWPNDAYWMETPRPGGGGGGIFWDDKPFLWDRKKPVYIGEYLWVPTADPGPHTIFFGDEAYKSHDTYRTSGKAFAWRMQMLAYRHYGVSGQSPWTVIEHGPLNERNPCWVAQRDLYRPLAAFLREVDSRFFGGETVSRTVETFNDSMADQPEVKLHWALVDGDKALSEGNEVMNLSSGEHRELKVRVPMPQVQERRKLMLQVTLQGRGEERFQEVWPVEVFPRPSKWSLPDTPFLLFDPGGQLQKVWERDKVAFRSLKRLEDWDGKSVLVIGPEALSKEEKGEAIPVLGGEPGPARLLSQRVQAGGRVLVLEQTEAASNWLPVSLTAQSSTMAFPQRPSHPVLRGLSAEDFRWWRGQTASVGGPTMSLSVDNMVSQHEPVRPTLGAMRPLVVTGAAGGLSHAPLLEVPQGSGVWMLCQLQVVSKLDTEPVAQMLLERMLDYIASYSPSEGNTLCLGPPGLQEQLTRLGVDWHLLTDWNGLRRPQVQVLVMQPGGDTIAQHADDLRAFLKAGGRVLWHRPAQKDFDRVRDVLNLPFERQPYQGSALRAEGEGPILEALTREDLYWLGLAGEVPWSARPLATDMAEGVFSRHFDASEGQTFEAEEDVQLEGHIVRVERGEIIFATVGRAHWKVNIPETGSYAIGLVGRGTQVDKVYPVAEVSFDDQGIGVVCVGSAESRTYGLSFQAKAGEHRLTVAFTNDASAPPEDRNLYVDKFVLVRDKEAPTVQPLTVPPALVNLSIGKGQLVLSAIRWDEPGRNATRANRFICSLLTGLGARFGRREVAGVVEAEQLRPQPDLAWCRREADHVYMGSSGYIEGPVRIAKGGRYRVYVRGKGQPAKGQYPILAVELDGKELGQVECKSDDWNDHLLTVELPEGKFTLRLRFTNDLFEPPEDRNLWIDRLEFEGV